MFSSLVVLISIALLAYCNSLNYGDPVTHLVQLNEKSMTITSYLPLSPTAPIILEARDFPLCAALSLRPDYFFTCSAEYPVLALPQSTMGDVGLYKARDVTAGAALTSNNAVITPPPTPTYKNEVYNPHRPTTCISGFETCSAVWVPFGVHPVSNAAIPRGQIFGVGLARFGYSYWKMPFLKPRSPLPAPTAAKTGTPTPKEPVSSDISKHQQDISSTGTNSEEKDRRDCIDGDILEPCDEPVPDDSPLSTCVVMATAAAYSLAITTECAAVVYHEDSETDDPDGLGALGSIPEVQVLCAVVVLCGVCLLSCVAASCVRSRIARREAMRMYPELFVVAPMPEMWPHAARQTREEVLAQRHEVSEFDAEVNGGNQGGENGESHGQAHAEPRGQENGTSFELQDMSHARTAAH